MSPATLKVCPILFPNCNQIWIFSTDFRKGRKDQISRNSLQWDRADTCGKTDMTKVIGVFREYAKEPNECTVL